MADNFVTNAGSGGSTFASDAIGTSPEVHYSRVKVSIGCDGVAQDNWNVYRNVASSATTQAATIKASAGAVGLIFAVNLNAAVRFLKLYNKASSPTVGTDTPIATLPIPASATGAGFSLSIPNGLLFNIGIGVAVTTAYADSDTGAVAAGELFYVIGYV